MITNGCVLFAFRVLIFTSTTTFLLLLLPAADACYLLLLLIFVRGTIIGKPATASATCTPDSRNHNPQSSKNQAQYTHTNQTTNCFRRSLFAVEANNRFNRDSANGLLCFTWDDSAPEDPCVTEEKEKTKRGRERQKQKTKEKKDNRSSVLLANEKIFSKPPQPHHPCVQCLRAAKRTFQ
jgi:hypothetical protein